MTREELIKQLQALPYGMEIRCARKVGKSIVIAHDIESIGTGLRLTKDCETVIGVIYFNK